jgi:hypothetical protein
MLSLADISHSALMRRPVAHVAKAAGLGLVRRTETMLHRELAAAGLERFRPAVYLGDEWFSPEGVPAIAVPFYLAHPRLTALERRLMQEVEGATPTWFRRLVRHEAGHSFDHAYQISRMRAFRQLFGDPGRRYAPNLYKFDPDSRDFVRHLPGFYAQAHPDEDFAETFAVCITPQLEWRRRYAAWPGALAKLEFVAELIERFQDRDPSVEAGPLYFNACRMRVSLAAYYRRRLADKSALERRRGGAAPGA